MKKILTLLIINIVLALLQTSFFPVLFGKTAYINWVLALGFSWLLIDAPLTSLKSVFLGGIILDILLGSRLGLSSFIMTVGVYILILVRSYLFRGIVSHLFVGTFVAYIYVLILIAKDSSFNFSLLVMSFITAVLSFVLSVLFKQILVKRS